MSLAGSCPVLVPSHRLTAAGPSPRATRLVEMGADAFQAAVLR
jgi:hypothetical protein